MNSLPIEKLSSCISGLSFHYDDVECQNALENLGWGAIGILAGAGRSIIGIASFVGGLWSFAKGAVGIPNYCIYV